MISGTSPTEFTSSLKSVKIILPSIYNMGPGITLNCVQQAGFNSNPTCKTTANNEISINMDNAKIGTSQVLVEITNVINPLFEGGNYVFTFEMVRKLFFFKILFYRGLD